MSRVCDFFLVTNGICQSFNIESGVIGGPCFHSPEVGAWQLIGIKGWIDAGNHHLAGLGTPIGIGVGVFPGNRGEAHRLILGGSRGGSSHFSVVGRRSGRAGEVPEAFVHHFRDGVAPVRILTVDHNVSCGDCSAPLAVGVVEHRGLVWF